MREKVVRRLFVWFVLLVLVIGQGNMAFAAPPSKPTKPPVEPTSSLNIVTNDLNFIVPEDQPFEFYVDATTKFDYKIIWEVISTEDSSLQFMDVEKTQKSTKKTITYLEKARFVFTPTDDDQPRTVNYTIFASEDASGTINKDQITVTFDVMPVFSENNSSPLAMNDLVETELDLETLIQPLLNDTDPDGDIITLVSVKDEDGGVIPFEGADIRYTPTVTGTIKLYYVITDGKATADGIITITVTKTLVYVALGDSIPAGVSYEYNQTGGTIESYTDKLYKNLENQFTNVVYYDEAISGMNIYLPPDSSNPDEISLYDQVMLDSDIRDYITSADLITVCIGANDIMDAARRKIADYWIFEFEYIDFYDIEWAKADLGRATFEYYWPKIIDQINVLNPDVELMVMTVYNPYNLSDNGTYNIVEGQNINLSIHDQVDLYLSSTSESFRGINTIIRNYEFENDYTLSYKVVDVYSHFEFNYGNSKGDVTGFYGLSPILGIPIKDPHPDINGHNEIYNLHLSVHQ